MQILTVSANCNKQKLFLTAVYKSPSANKENFLEFLLNHMFELKIDKKDKHNKWTDTLR